MSKITNLNTLMAFVAVARDGSVSRAAETLHITQPAVSHQLKRLSEETGLTLFDRTSSGLKLTQDGAQLLSRAEQVLSALSDFQRSAQRRAGRISGKLRIGTIIDPEFIRLGQFLVRLVETYPDLQIELLHGMSGEVLERIQRKQLDVGFYLSGPQSEGNPEHPDEKEFHVSSLARFRYCVVAPPGWDSAIKQLDWPELSRLPWIGTHSQSVHHRLIERELQPLKASLNIVALVDQEASMLEMVRSGIGLSLCRESIALREQQAHGLIVSEKVHVPCDMSFITPKNRRNDPAIKAVFELLEELWSHQPYSLEQNTSP
ncbi:LysR family transcriptional regulator [Kiloniella sp. b19]|uniref:LysR family transcriptional regulator n=1 Tax=Kiloniella sp. GXU_MW_B19 TaxID=3141326 RepID=UPI0031DFC6FC